MRRDEKRPAVTLPAGSRVALIGLFSGKDRNLGATLDRLAASVEAQGAQVVGRHVQRRGVSRGGVSRMATPFSRRTLLSPGKAREVAQACREAAVDVAVFVNPLTPHQRTVLAGRFGCPVVDSTELSARVG